MREREPIWVSVGKAPSGVKGAKPLVRETGAKPPEADDILTLETRRLINHYFLQVLATDGAFWDSALGTSWDD